jgi:hypothetical protein
VVLDDPRVIESYLGVETATIERSGVRGLAASAS